MRWRRIWPVLGAALGALIVIASMTLTHPGWGFLSRTECQLEDRLGNVTVWVPQGVVASPYHGTVTGRVDVWSKLPGENLSVSLSFEPVEDGNVTAFFVSYENWTVFSQRNVSELGPGPQSECQSPVVGYPSPNPVEGLSSGGTTSWPMYSQLVSDSGLMNGLNGSQLCAEVENTSNSHCGAGAQFRLSFQSVSGTIDTCGSTLNRTLPIFSTQWPVVAPFEASGHTYSVPLDPGADNSANYANGTYGWYNYTFPANGGVWQYDNLAQTSSTGAGLVFSYSPCP
jgi:hypothetical protein